MSAPSWRRRARVSAIVRHRMAQRLSNRISTSVIAGLVMYALAGSALAQPASCPIAPDPAALPDAPALEKMNAFVARLGVPPTGSKAHVRYVDSIRRRLKKIPRQTIDELEFPIERCTAGRAKLAMIAGGR